MKKFIAASIILIALVALARLTMAPAQVPIYAWPRFSIKNGVGWYWDRDVPEGCVSWMAMERWASIRVLADTDCRKWGSEEHRNAKGLYYSSTTDESTFYGYWDWPRGTSFDYYVYDDEGNWVRTEPCPYSLAERQVARIREVIKSAKSLSQTKEELARHCQGKCT